MHQHFKDVSVYADRYCYRYLKCRCAATLNEEIDAALARVKSVEQNRDMTLQENINRRDAWEDVANVLTDLKRKNT